MSVSMRGISCQGSAYWKTSRMPLKRAEEQLLSYPGLCHCTIILRTSSLADLNDVEHSTAVKLHVAEVNCVSVTSEERAMLLC